MDNKMTNILVVKPGMVKRADKRLLNDSGIVVIETDDPQSIRLITPEVEFSGSELLLAALVALDSSPLSQPKENMIKIMRKLLEAKSQP